MRQVEWIYIIDNTGATLFSYEIHIQGSGNINNSLMSHFLFALQTIAKDLSTDEIKMVEMGNNKFFLNKEKSNDSLFILKSNREADPQIITPFLNQIKERFVEKFKGYNDLFVDEKIELLNSFKGDIRELLQQKTNLEKFSETI